MILAPSQKVSMSLGYSRAIGGYPSDGKDIPIGMMFFPREGGVIPLITYLWHMDLRYSRVGGGDPGYNSITFKKFMLFPRRRG